MQEGIHLGGGWRGGVVGEGQIFSFDTFYHPLHLCLTFTLVWPIEDFVSEIRQIDKLRNYMINLNTYKHYRRDEYNIYAVIENNVPSWLWGLKKHTGTYI